MKKIVGIILLVIVGLNIITISVRASSGEQVGSPLYVIILILFMFGGIALISSSKQGESETDEN